MQLKRGQFGQFLACTGYPDCKTTQQLGQAQRKPDVMLEEECPKCSSKACGGATDASASSPRAAIIRNANT